MRSQEDYNNVIKLHLAGYSYRKIMEEIKVSRNTVIKMIKHHKATVNMPDSISPGEERKWKSKSAVRVKREFGIHWEEKLPLIENPNIKENNCQRRTRRKPTIFVRCPSCGAKIAENFPCVACYQKLICFNDQICYFNELNRVNELAFPIPKGE